MDRRRGILMKGVQSEQIMDFGICFQIHVKEFTIEADNGVTNTQNYNTYLANAATRLGMPGTFLGFSLVESKPSYTYNEIAGATHFQVSGATSNDRCYRYRNGTFENVNWNMSTYDAKAVAGTKVYLYTAQLVRP